MAIKQEDGQLDRPEGVRSAVVASSPQELAINHQSAQVAGELPLPHRDPLDRILGAQAQIEPMAIMTVGPVFDAYDVVTV